MYALLGAAVAVGFPPCLHWLRLCAAGEVVCVEGLQWGMLSMAGFYTLGYAFFVSKFPEACFPKGFFDLVGASHQIWHVFVFLGSASWLEACLRNAVEQHVRLVEGAVAAAAGGAAG